jgi:protein SCO1/2
MRTRARHSVFRDFACIVPLVGVLIAMTPGLVLCDPAAPASRSNIVHADYLPNVNLIDMNGRAISLESLKGKPVLVSFVHVSCKGVCQMITAKMREVAQRLGPKFRSHATMLSLTTDPAEDGPAQLLSYARDQHADGRGWVFATGRPEQIDRVLALYRVPKEDPDQAMTHEMKLFLIAPDGAELRQYNAMSVRPGVVASDIINAGRMSSAR